MQVMHNLHNCIIAEPEVKKAFNIVFIIKWLRSLFFLRLNTFADLGMMLPCLKNIIYYN